MRFKVDENLPNEVAVLLRRSGHEATTVHEQGLAGADDRAILSACRTVGETLLSLDLDFADIRLPPSTFSSGIVVIRSRVHEIEHILGIVARLIPLFVNEPVSQLGSSMRAVFEYAPWSQDR